MNTYTIFNSQKIIMILKVTEDTLLLNLKEGESYVEGSFSDEFYYVKNNEIKQYPSKPNYVASFDLQNEQWVLNENTALSLLRYERDILLSQSDWTQAIDSPLSDSKKLEWATYRQNLRDLPSTVTDPLNVNYPEKPE